MDILSDIFTTLNFSGTLYFRTEFAGRWAVTVPTLESAARFHLVIKGRCHVAIAGGPAHVLHPGDLILVPRGKSHILSDSARTTAPPLETVIERSGYTGNGLLVYGTNAPGLETQLACGHFSFRPSADHPILRYLPDSIIASAQDRAKMPLLDEALRLITERAFSENLGSTAALTRLSEIIFVEILQSRLRGDEGLAFLLEALSDFQVTVPELGTIRAPAPPIVIVTSNRTREVHDALKRRCLYHWVDYPDFEREIAILHARAPEAAERLSREVVAFVQRLRTEDLFKKPGVAETIDWAKCLLALDVIDLSPEVIADTLGAVLKYQDDIARLQGSEAARILAQARAALEPA